MLIASCSGTGFPASWLAPHYVLLVILPTCLIGFVPVVHTAFLMLVSSLCRLAGQVICAHGGVSRYCIVNMFFMVQDKAVTWLSTPVYPCPPFKIVVKVRLMTPAQQLLCRSVIPVDRIQPCTVSVLPASDGIYFYMMRDKGIDRTV